MLHGLLRAGAAPDARPAGSGPTALQLAAAANYPALVALLLGHGAAVDAADADGATALQAACLAGFLEVVRLLLWQVRMPLPRS